MQQLIVKTIIIQFYIIICFCFQEQNIQFLVDNAYSYGIKNAPQYSDDVHKMLFSSFLLKPANPSFTIVGNLNIPNNPTHYTNIFQIYNTLNPDKKIVMFGFDELKSAIFVRQQNMANTYQGEILCSNYQQMTQVQSSKFTLSLKKTEQSIDIYLEISIGSTILCSSSEKITSNVLDWNFSDYTVRFSNSGAPGASRDEYSSSGSVFNVFLIRDTFIDSFGNVAKTFIKRIALNTQEGLNIINQFNPNSDIQFKCVPDESIVKWACGKPTNINKLPLINNSIATFSAGQDIIFNYFYFRYLFYSYYLYGQLPYFKTFSFWLYLESNSNNIRQIFKASELNQLILNLIQNPDDPNMYQIQVNIINETTGSKIYKFSQKLNLKQYYFVIVSIHYFIDQELRIIVLDQNGILSEELFNKIDYQKFQNERFSLQIGNDQNDMNSVFKLSQFQMNMSSAILYDEKTQRTIIDELIDNCQVVILVRLKYQCLVCKKGYYLFQNKCNDQTNNPCQCIDENGNPCNIEYFIEPKIRSCIRKCSYRCSTCNQNDPNICITCSSIDRDISSNCKCKEGYEDLVSQDCSQLKALNINNDEVHDILFSYKQTPALSSIELPFKKYFQNIPQVISILTTIKNFSSYMKGVQINIKNVSQQSFYAEFLASYGGPEQTTEFVYNFLTLDSDSKRYFSKLLMFDTFDPQYVQTQQIDIGTYDKNKYGDYQILTFISGLFVGQSTSYTYAWSNFKVEVINSQTQIQVTVNSNVKMIQITYLVLQKAIPALTYDHSFNSGSFFYDLNNQFSRKIHADTINISNNLMIQKKQLFSSYSSLTAMNLQIKYYLRLGYSYAPQNDLDKQYTRFEGDSNQINSYSSNGFYLSENFVKSIENCLVKDLYTQNGCYQCKVKNADKDNSCNSCLGNRVYQVSSCDCPDSEFTKSYADEANCSYKGAAVLDVKLSTDFSKLTIDFGLPIEPIQVQPQNEPNNDFCKYIFSQETYLLISESAKCSIDNQLIIIDLDEDASILNKNVVKFTQNLKFKKYTVPITQFFRTTVSQDKLQYNAEVDISYKNEMSLCDFNTIKVLKFKNNQNRTVYYSWSLKLQSSPNNSNDAVKIQELFDTANQKKSLILFLNGYFEEKSSVTILFEYSYQIGLKGQKEIQFIVVNKPNLILKSNLKNNAPYYKKDSFEIFYQISYHKCDINGQVFQIFPATFNLQYQASNNLQLTNTIASLTQKQFSIVIPQFTTQSNIDYKITVICTVKDTFDSNQIDFDLPITAIPLLIQIRGGDRLHGYNQQLTIEAVTQDLDMQGLDQTSGINLQWSCKSLETGKPCIDLEGLVIPIPQGSNLITFSKNTFICYSTLQFTLQGTKDIRKVQSEIIIQFVDQAIPILTVNFSDEFLLKETINMNDVIEATIVLDSQEDVNKLYFGGVVLYNKEVQATINFEYGKVRIQLWDYFTNFDEQNPKFQLRFMVFNPKYTMPSQMVTQLKLNFPPKKCFLDILPPTGDSLTTLFAIYIKNCSDTNQPIQYQYYYYTSPELFDIEKKNPLLVQRKQISDKVLTEQIQTYLPSGDILILVQAIDSFGAILNITKTITVKQSVFNQQLYTNQIQNLINDSEKQLTSDSILTLSLLCEDIVLRTDQFQTIKNESNQIVNLLFKLTNEITKDSTFSTLATQSIQLLIKSKILQGDDLLIQQLFNYISGVLDNASLELKQEKYLQDKSNQQLYNCFNLLDSTANILQSNLEDQQNLIKQTERVGLLLNVDAYPNESAKILKGQKISIISQVITRKKLPFYLGIDDGQSNWESQLIEQSNKDFVNQVYDVSFKSYDQNIYENSKQFKNFIDKVKEVKPTIDLNSYKAINPQIKLHLQNDDFALDQKIKFTFQAKQQETLTCINYVKDQWSAQGCISNYDKETRSCDCICNKLSPITVINDIADIFDENQNIKTIFSGDGIENILGFDDFQDYAAFWVQCFIAIIFIILSVFGIYFDHLRKSQSQNLIRYSKISSVSPSIPPIQVEDNQVLKTIDILDTLEDRQTQKTIQANSEKKQDSSKFSRRPLKSQRIELKLETETAIKQNPILHTLSPETQHLKDKTKKPIKEGEVQTTIRIKQPSRQESDCSIFQKTQSEISITDNSTTLDGRDKFIAIKFYKAALYFHDLVSIFLIYDPSISRFQRLAIIYLKNLHIFTSNIIFNQQYTIVQTVFLQIINLTFVIIITKLIELGISKNIVLRRICQFVIISMMAFYYYSFLAVISGSQPSETNTISKYYFLVLLIDNFGVGLALSFLQRSIAKCILSNQSNLTGFKLVLYGFLKLQIILANL